MVRGLNLQVVDLAGVLGLELAPIPAVINRCAMMAEQLRLSQNLTELGELEAARLALREAVTMVAGRWRPGSEEEEIWVSKLQELD